MINKITIVGRLVDAPSIKWTPNGKAVANFKIASTRSYKDKNTGEKPTDFPMVVVWGNDAEFIANNGKKGAMLALTGRLETRSYDHKEYPIKVYVTEINAEEIQLLDWDNDGQGGGQRSQSNNNQGGSYGGGNYGNNNNQGGYGNNNQGGGYNQGGQRNNSGYGGGGQGYGGNNQGYGSNQGGGYGQSGNHMPGGKTIDINDDDLPF